MSTPRWDLHNKVWRWAGLFRVVTSLSLGRSGGLAAVATSAFVHLGVLEVLMTGQRIAGHNRFLGGPLDPHRRH